MSKFDKSTSCDGKTRYTSKKAASGAAASLNGKIKMEAYECEHCGFYHFGHTKKKHKGAFRKEKTKVKLDVREFDSLIHRSKTSLIIRICA